MAIDPGEAARLGQEESADIKEDFTVVLADFFRTAVGKNHVLPTSLKSPMETATSSPRCSSREMARVDCELMT
jgi:hypothetical protein